MTLLFLLTFMTMNSFFHSQATNLETLKNGGAVTLNSRVVSMDNSQQGVECYITNILVCIKQEPTKDVDGQHLLEFDKR